MVGSVWTSDAGNTWRVVEIRGNRILVELIAQSLPCKGNGARFWWGADSLTTMHRVS